MNKSRKNGKNYTEIKNMLAIVKKTLFFVSLPAREICESHLRQ